MQFFHCARMLPLLVKVLLSASVNQLQAEVGTLTKLVDDLQQLSMSDEGALAYQKAPVDLICNPQIGTVSSQ